jgi:GntR family transcriptional repressor for pyruvate dehydrogenase complex
MALRPVTRRSVPDEVFEQLLSEMVGGGLPPGKPLPSERKLAEALGVSRPAVREALQRMAHAGLVDVRQGDTTMVRDYRRHAGLDLLPRLLVAGDQVDVGVARSILEARLHVGPKIAELAAARGGARLRAELDAAIAALEAADSPVDRQNRALEYWDHVVDGADSIVFRLMFNGLRAAYLPALGALATVMAAEVERTENYRALAEAIVAGDAEGAKAAADRLLRPATEALLTALAQLEELAES